MASYNLANSSDITRKLWVESVHREMEKETYFKKFMGESADSLVQVKKDLSAGRGGQLYYQLLERNTGSFVTGDSTLEGNEDSLTLSSDSVTLEAYRFAIRYNALLTQQRAAFDLPAEAKRNLIIRGSEKMDGLLFDALTDRAPTVIFHKASGTITRGTVESTVVGNITAADLITPKLIRTAKAYAVTGGLSSGKRVIPPLRPIKVEGKNYYVLLIHPDVGVDLKNNAEYAQAIREAEVRGPSNPLFSGSLAILDGVVIHEHENVVRTTNASSVEYSKNFFLGAQALLWGIGRPMKMTEEIFDYGAEKGIGIEMIVKAQKPRFTFQGTSNTDYGSFGLYSATSAASTL